MPRRKKANGKEVSHENCVTKIISNQRSQDLNSLVKVKARDEGKKFKLVPIEGVIRAFKQVEIK